MRRGLLRHSSVCGVFPSGPSFDCQTRALGLRNTHPDVTRQLIVKNKLREHAVNEPRATGRSPPYRSVQATHDELGHLGSRAERKTGVIQN